MSHTQASWHVLLILFNPDCGNLKAPTNGYVTFTNEALFESTATYTCDNGYYLSEDINAQRDCQADTTWTNVSPTCIIYGKLTQTA